MTPPRASLLAPLALALLCAAASAQDAPPTPERPAPRDPFDTPPAMERVAATGGDPGQPGTRAASGDEPRVRTRGVLKLEGRPAVALLEVEGLRHVVHEGDALRLEGWRLVVTAIGRGGVTYRLEPLPAPARRAAPPRAPAPQEDE